MIKQFSCPKCGSSLTSAYYDSTTREFFTAMCFQCLSEFDEDELCDTRQDRNRDPDIPPATKVTDDEIKYWMEKLNNNKSQVAKRLGVSYRTILRRTKNLYH